MGVLTFTTQDTNIGGDAGLPEIYTVGYGAGTYVAIALRTSGGNDAPWIASSPDGVNWTDHGDGGTGLTAEVADDIAYGAGAFVAVGAGGRMIRSADGANWVSVTSSFGTSGITAVAYGGGFFVAVGVSGKIATSTDGTTWTQRTSGFGTTLIQGVAYSGTRWVIVGNSGKFSYATDPTSTWTNGTVPSPQTILDVAYGGGLFVAISSANVWYTSPDGITWTDHTALSEKAVAYGSGYFLAVGDTGTAFSSPDGLTWTAESAGFGTDQMNDVVYGGGRFVVAGFGGIGVDEPRLATGILSGAQLQRRNSRTGNLLDAVSIPETTEQIRATPNAQHVFLLYSDNSFERYDRDLELEETVTISGFATELQDWNVDDEFNIYRLAGDQLWKYNRDGEELWYTDINTETSYFCSPDAAGNGQQVFIDEHVRVVGGAFDRAVLLTVGRSLGAIRSVQKFKSDGEAIFLAGGRNGQCINLVGKHDGTEFEGDPLASGHFLMRIWAARAD